MSKKKTAKKKLNVGKELVKRTKNFNNKIAKNMKKKKVVSKKPTWKTFEDWWDKVAQKKVDKIERDWIKKTEPNDPDDDDGGGDSWHVNQMMHDGEAHNMTYEIAEEVFNKGKNDEAWEMNMGDCLFCDLDSVIIESYEAGKISGQKNK